MTRSENILEKMQRERLIEEHRARQRTAFFRLELLVGKTRRLLQGAQVIPGVYADGADFGSGLEDKLSVFQQRRAGLRSCQQKVGIVGARARCILGVRALQPDVRGAQRILPCGTRIFCLHSALDVLDRLLGARHLIDGRQHIDLRQIDLELRADVRDGENPV